ncbi:hypothetical protein DBV15_11044 [Temnothorax longispinosus]|uniref:Uncharacterized protein n=1 Tax=Temnothorax longispinosus TaxID=300112 RepID=A0A4S2KN86_9HYME|nr:hypothetical protein DBV15_11044 [Temnothorax longispinosus]
MLKYFATKPPFLAVFGSPLPRPPCFASLASTWRPPPSGAEMDPITRVGSRDAISPLVGAPGGGGVSGWAREEEMANKSPRVGSRGLSGCWFGSIALVCFTIQRRSATLFKYSGCSVVVGVRHYASEMRIERSFVHVISMRKFTSHSKVGRVARESFLAEATSEQSSLHT